MFTEITAEIFDLVVLILVVLFITVQNPIIVERYS